MANEPPLHDSFRIDHDQVDGYFYDSEYSHRKSVPGSLLIVLLVLLIHLLLFWLVFHHSKPIHTAGSNRIGQVYQVTYVPISTTQTRSNATSQVPPVGTQQASRGVSASASSASADSSSTSTVQMQPAPRTASRHSARHVNTARHPSERPNPRRSGASRRAHARREAGQHRHSSTLSGHGGMHALPSAQSLIQQVVSSASSAGWQQAAEQFAEGPSTNSQRNAIDRYIAYFTRAVQTYIDMNLGAENVASAQMTLNITVSRSGRLLQVVIAKSTGYRKLDQLAVKTLYQAGPYSPFDPDMGDIPQLSFSRGWVFGEGSYFHFQ